MNNKNMTTVREPDPLLTRSDLARILKSSERTIDRLIERDEIPEPIRIGRCVRWSRATIDKWIADQAADRAQA